MPAPDDLRATRAGRFFWALTARPKVVLAFSLLLIAISAAFVSRLRQDTSVEAFAPADHPSVEVRQAVAATFGAADLLLVAIVHDGATGIFNPHTLALLEWLTDQIDGLAGVAQGGVRSLATTHSVTADADGVVVKALLDPLPETTDEAAGLRAAVLRDTLHVGRLVTRDGRATLIIVELSPAADGADVYARILDLVREAPIGEEDVHVAGEAAVSAYLGTYIDADARQLYPMAFLTITFVLVVCYRTWGGVILPILVVAGAVGVALGAMAASGTPFYVITNALPVILIAIGVSDAVHILGRYYEELATRPSASSREPAVRTMVHMYRPVIVTSVTDAAGFLALGLTSVMPPVRSFGWYAALGTAAALLFSLVSIPSCLVLLPRRVVGAFASIRPRGGAVTVDMFGRFMVRLGDGVVRHPAAVVAAAAVVTGIGLVGVSRVQVDEDRIENFKSSEPIYQADRAINRAVTGTNLLDIVLSTPDPEGLHEPGRLQRIDALQSFVDATPHVRTTTSLVDFLKHMNRVLHDGRDDAYRLPETGDLVAQSLLLYEASGTSPSLQEYVDHEHRQARMRVQLDTARYSDERAILARIEDYLRQHFREPGLTATLSGRAVVDQHWLGSLAASTFMGLVFALVAVWTVASIAFRSAFAGALATVPVSMAVLVVYAGMGLAGIWLGVGTSMFAAIAIGTAVNPALRIIHGLAVLTPRTRSVERSVRILFGSTGRGLLFDSAAVVLGFAVLTTSDVPPLVWFGVLVTVCVVAAFVATVALVPALCVLVRPKFLYVARGGAERGEPPPPPGDPEFRNRGVRCVSSSVP